jgi:hypothetical protein
MKVRKPKFTSHGYAWQSAYAMAIDRPNMLPAHIYELLCGAKYLPDDREKPLHKYYDTYDEAVQALLDVLKTLRNDIRYYSNIQMIEEA